MDPAFRAFEFMLPAILLAFAVALVISAAFRMFSALAKDGAPVKFFDVLRFALAFGGYALILGILVGLTENLLIVTALGTVTTLGSTYLAYLYGKDATTDGKQLLIPALLTFFVDLPLVIEYVRLFLHT